MILPLLPVTMETSLLEVSIFIGFLYWLCPSFMNSILQGLARMVDVVTSRMFESFNRFTPNQTSQTDSLSTISHMKRFSKEQRCKRAISREADIKNRENNLFDIKENTPDLQLPRPKSIIRLACQNCSYSSRESLMNATSEKMALKNMFNYTFQKNGIIRKYFSDVYHNWQIRKFPYDLPTDETILKDDRLVKSIERMTKEQFEDASSKSEDLYENIQKNNEKRAEKLLKDMKSALNDYVLRCSNWFFHKMFPLFLNSVLVHPGQIAMLKEASKSGLPMIFLPLHRSHLDYLLLTYIVYNNEIKAPIVAAGDNLRLPFFGEVLRGLGAFYIKRRIDPVEGRKDHIYKSILHTYMNHSLRMGNNIEFYIEGGRTRTGKPLMPKYGVFSVLVDSLLDGTIEDALLVPVSMNYDKLVDGNFVSEQLGEPKKMENVWDTIKSLWKSVNGDYGMVKVDFNQPCSLRELVKAFKNTENTSTGDKKKLYPTFSTSSIYGTEIVSSKNKNVVENISRHVVYDAYESTSVMATNAVAFLLLTKFRNGVSIEKLATALDELRTDLNYSQKELSFRGQSVDVINYAIDMLGPALVRKDKNNMIKPQINLPHSIELSYYSNTLVPFFALDSIIALAINVLDNDNSGNIDAEELLEMAQELCDILQYEFIFCKPCQNVEETIRSYLDDLIFRKQIFILENETVLESKSRKLAMELEENEDELFYVPLKYKMNPDTKTRENLEFYREIVLPILECYIVTSQTVRKLVGKSMLESEIIRDALDNLKTQLLNNSVLHSEAVSTDSVKNALKLFVKWRILECHNEGKLRMYCFREGLDNEETAKDLSDRLRKFCN